MNTQLSKEALNIISVRSDLDIVAARMAVRLVARQMGFHAIDQARIATATSELTRNILTHAREGTVTMREIHMPPNRVGLEIIFEDQGPGISDSNGHVSEAVNLENGKQLGLAGASRLMDTMDIDSTTGIGTKIICQKWLRY